MIVVFHHSTYKMPFFLKQVGSMGKSKQLHSVQSIEAARHVLYVRHSPVVIAHHLLHQLGVASHLHALSHV